MTWPQRRHSTILSERDPTEKKERKKERKKKKKKKKKKKAHTHTPPAGGLCAHILVQPRGAFQPISKKHHHGPRKHKEDTPHRTGTQQRRQNSCSRPSRDGCAIAPPLQPDDREYWSSRTLPAEARAAAVTSETTQRDQRVSGIQRDDASVTRCPVPPGSARVAWSVVTERAKRSPGSSTKSTMNATKTCRSGQPVTRRIECVMSTKHLPIYPGQSEVSSESRRRYRSWGELLDDCPQ